MNEETWLLLSLAGIVAAGVGGNWLATRLHVPSILVLLLVGVIIGPVTGLLVPERTFGELLLPVVSLSVGIILFEGGLSLRLADLKQIGRPLLGLLTIGALCTWVVCSSTAVILLDMPLNAALLLGAILVVTGPTVVTPLLQHIRPTGKVGQIARWEGIVIDPLGAIAAVLVFEAIASDRVEGVWETLQYAATSLAITIGLGAAAGLLTAYGLAFVLRRHWAPDHLQSPLVFASVLSAFACSNALQSESGLLTVTVMGIVLANQKALDLKHIIHFKETLTVLLISTLFVVLTARLSLAQFTALGWRGFAFVAVVILVARPVSVWLATSGSALEPRERVFLGWLAPRGIVAAAVSSVFALEMGPAGDVLVTATFLVIIGTVAVYGLTSGLVARRLGLSVADPQGVLMAGANPTAQAMAAALKKAGVAVRLVDTNRDNVKQANMLGLPTLYANVLSDTATELLDLAGVGRFLAVTPNDEVNSLACVHFRELFGRANVFRLRAADNSRRKQASTEAQFGRVLLGPDQTLQKLDGLLRDGWRVTTTKITEQFSQKDFRETYNNQAIAVFLLESNGRLRFFTEGPIDLELKPGQQVIAFVPDDAPAAK